MDMDNPFFWSRPSVRPTTFRGIPVYSPEQQVHPRNQPATAKVFSSSNTPKVVQIPVHFVNSKPSSRSASALKIQKVFRGFLVRKSMKRIIEIKKDVDEIERRISMNDTVELIRRNEKEKLKMNEMLMALLFKLDSIRGIDLGVRVCRRSVIKKVIALQERIDSIVPVTDQGEIQISGGQNLESTGSAGENLVEDGDQINESSAANFEQIISSDAEGQNLESTGSAGENLVEDGDQIKESPAVNFENGPQKSSESKDHVQLEPSEVVTDSANPVADNAEETIDGNSEVNEFGANSEMKVEEEDHSMEDEVESEIMVKEEEIMETNSNEGGEVSEKPAWEEMEEGEGGGRTDDNKRNRELLEKMMEDNEKMMNLMSQLCERNEKQMKMLNSLTQRVEQLEKAFVCHILRRKKGRHSP